MCFCPGVQFRGFATLGNTQDTVLCSSIPVCTPVGNRRPLPCVANATIFFFFCFFSPDDVYYNIRPQCARHEKLYTMGALTHYVSTRNYQLRVLRASGVRRTPASAMRAYKNALTRSARTLSPKAVYTQISTSLHFIHIYIRRVYIHNIFFFISCLSLFSRMLKLLLLCYPSLSILFFIFCWANKKKNTRCCCLDC